MITYDDLTKEQQTLIDLALQGKNVLVDACIGSGKTTTIQVLCNVLKNKSILYLTYNKILKADAKAKIKENNTYVQNYHGYAYVCVKNAGYSTSQIDCIKDFLDFTPRLHGNIDLIVLDEYQDINDDIAKMLTNIKDRCPGVQIVAVGDMCQKIYATSALKAHEFVTGLLDQPERVYFTKCFRLSKDYAKKLGDAWNKSIEGVNPNCKIEEMAYGDVKNYLKKQDAKDVLVLGPMGGGTKNIGASRLLNDLEKECLNKYNKNTVYAQIRAENAGNVDISDTAAIFTTYDSSKGLERKICVIFDYTEDYYFTRMNIPMTEWDILRNIFLVAASRGKEHIIYVKPSELSKKFVAYEELGTPKSTNLNFGRPFYASKMFDFKYDEDKWACMQYLDTEVLPVNNMDKIKVSSLDGMIDLSPCIGIWQKANFFENYNIEEQVEYIKESDESGFNFKPIEKVRPKKTLDDWIYYALYCETKQNRYTDQTGMYVMDSDAKNMILNRLRQEFNPDEEVQKSCAIVFHDPTSGNDIRIEGVCDVVKDDIVWELKFVDALTVDHYLQLATYMLAMDMDDGILWNVKTNEMVSVQITNRKMLFNAIVYTITKRSLGGARIDKTMQCALKDRKITFAKNSKVLSRFKKFNAS